MVLPAFPACLARTRHAGEIIPQAACSRYGLQIGAYSAPFVRLLMLLTAPISYPIGWVLDRVLGHRHTALFRRAELKALMDIHREGHEFGGQLSAGKHARKHTRMQARPVAVQRSSALPAALLPCLLPYILLLPLPPPPLLLLLQAALRVFFVSLSASQNADNQYLPSRPPQIHLPTITCPYLQMR